jgi:hypothetical protein
MSDDSFKGLDPDQTAIGCEEGSFIDFLIHKANERMQINKEILKDLDDALSEASAIVNNLRYGG